MGHREFPPNYFEFAAFAGKDERKTVKVIARFD